MKKYYMKLSLIVFLSLFLIINTNAQSISNQQYIEFVKNSCNCFSRNNFVLDSINLEFFKNVSIKGVQESTQIYQEKLATLSEDESLKVKLNYKEFQKLIGKEGQIRECINTTNKKFSFINLKNEIILNELISYLEKNEECQIFYYITIIGKNNSKR